MAKRINCPEQLPLQPEWGYLNWIATVSEEFNSFEKSSIQFLGNPKKGAVKRSATRQLSICLRDII